MLSHSLSTMNQRQVQTISILVWSILPPELSWIPKLLETIIPSKINPDHLLMVEKNMQFDISEYLYNFIRLRILRLRYLTENV
jgi:hypothetical protein